MRCRIGPPARVSIRCIASYTSVGAYQGHDLPHGPLHVEDLGSLNSNQTALASQLGEQHVGAIGLHHLADLIQTVEENVVDLVRGEHDVLDIDLHTHDQFPQLLLGASDILQAFSGDVDLILTPTIGPRRCVAENPGERRREVDGRIRGGFDHLDILARPATDEGVHGQFQFHGIDMTFQLRDGGQPRLVDSCRERGSVQFDQS